MRSFMVWMWGNGVDGRAAACAQTCYLPTARRPESRITPRHVDNPGVYTLIVTHLFRVVFHVTESLSLSIGGSFLPTINTPNKDNNNLIKPILLLGGCA